MVAGFWFNQDGLPKQYGTQKAIPEMGGDYLVYGETREIEQLVPLVPYQLTTGGQVVSAPTASFVGTTTLAAAGVQSLTTLMPLQQTAPVTALTGSNLVISAPQIFIEQVDVEPLVTATAGTSISIGLVTTSPASPSSAFVQVTPNPGVQIIDSLITANMVEGYKMSFTQPGSTGMLWKASNGSPIAGGGAWVGIKMPLVTNAITPLPNNAWLSVLQTGSAFTNGLLKVRIRYTIYGSINQ